MHMHDNVITTKGFLGPHLATSMDMGEGATGKEFKLMHVHNNIALTGTNGM